MHQKIRNGPGTLLKSVVQVIPFPQQEGSLCLVQEIPAPIAFWIGFPILMMNF
jgi:hypothetical protein